MAKKKLEHTEAELLEIAEGIYRGDIYTDRHLKDKNLLLSVFMVLALADEKTMKTIKDSKPGLFYEYLNKAGHLSINGCPIFASVRMLNEEDTKKVFSIVEKMQEAMKIVKESVVESSGKEK